MTKILVFTATYNEADNIKIFLDKLINIKQNFDVLIIDDILDEGETLAAVVEHCRAHRAASVLTAVLVDKLHERKVADICADFVGLRVEDRYLYGYGMDYRGYLRNAAGIYAVDPIDCD